MLLFGIPYLIKQSVGAGDLKIACSSGLFLGFSSALTAFFTAFLSCAAYAIFLQIYVKITKKATAKSKGQPHIIKNFEHLLKPPTVSGRLIQFTLLLEPTIYPRETIELRIDTSFGNKYKNFSFNADYGGQLGNWSSAFAGANFIGMSNVQRQNNKVKAIEEKGNIFNKQYQSLFIIHRGSTHTPEWSTQVDCSCTEED